MIIASDIYNEDGQAAGLSAAFSQRNKPAIKGVSNIKFSASVHLSASEPVINLTYDTLFLTV